MKTNAALLSVLALWFAFLSQPQLWAQEKSFEGDSLGKLSLGQKWEDALKVLGKPESKGGSTLWDATGEWVQDVEYPAQGLSLKVASKKKGGPQTVLMITASAPSALSTGRGIKIGSAESEVKKAYKDVLNAEDSEAGKTLVAGSVYGGVIFTLTKGKVSEIFIGAAAE